MNDNTTGQNAAQISIRPVDQDNWRNIAGLKVSENQRDFVADPGYYLALCSYGGEWHPMAIYLNDLVIGFLMWALDPADGSCWLGGILIDKSLQNRGYGKAAVQAAIAMLSSTHGFQDFALSYQPANLAARHLYSKIGFQETDEWEDDEIVARYTLTPAG